MDTPEDSPAPEAANASRWFQRVLPVTLAVLLVLAVVAAVSPSVRHQLDLSVSRQPPSYVELYFAKPSTGVQAVCIRTEKSARVSFTVRSHLENRSTVAYRIAVNPARNGGPTRRTSGTVAVNTGQARTVTESFALPRREGYVVSVRLPDLGQRLRAQCAGPRS